MREPDLSRSLGVVTMVSCLAAGALLSGCKREAPAPAPGVEIVSRTVITGTVNGSPFAGEVLASFNTRRGGRSSCEFSQLPDGFTPATTNTHT